MLEKYQGYRVLSHTADAKIRIYGKNLEELFLNGILGMYDICGATSELKPIKTDSWTIRDKDHENLLVTFLNEILYKLEMKFYILAKKISIQKYEITFEFEQYPLAFIEREIKAITYNELNIINQNGTFQTSVVFDI